MINRMRYAVLIDKIRNLSPDRVADCDRLWLPGTKLVPGRLAGARLARRLH